MYPVVIRSAVHAATRCALAITALHPGFNLRNLAYEEGKKRGSLHHIRTNAALAFRCRVVLGKSPEFHFCEHRRQRSDLIRFYSAFPRPHFLYITWLLPLYSTRPSP